MDCHILKLEKLCRICGGMIKTKKGYLYPKSVMDYKETIKNVYGINIEEEDVAVFPRNLCVTCKQRLDVIVKAEKHVSVKLACEFVPHTESDCKICHHVTSRNELLPSTARKEGIHLKTFDKVFKDSGFEKYRSKSSSDIIYYIVKESNSYVHIELTLRIKGDMSWNLYYNDNLVPESSYLNTFPQQLNDSNIKEFSEKLSNSNICMANNDFPKLLERRIDFKEPFPTASESGRSAWVESDTGTKLIKDNFTKIRSSKCLFIVEDSTICDECKNFRKNLSKYSTRARDMEQRHDYLVSDSSKVNTKNLTIEELRQRLQNAQAVKLEAIRQTSALSIKVQKLISEQAVQKDSISTADHELFETIMKTNSSPFEEGTTQWLLWNQQKLQASQKDARSMKWHPLIIRWCLSIYMISPAAYRQLNSKGNKFLVLPHINTLKKYIGAESAGSGFKPEVIEKLIEDCHLDSLDEYQKNVALSFDEIKVKSGIAYHRQTGKIIGFTEMGEMNDEIQNILRRNDEIEDPSLVRYVLVFMVREICSKLSAPIGYYGSTGFSSDEMFLLVWKATRVFEAVGFNVRSWTADGASPNRKLFKSSTTNPQDIHCTNNPYGANRKLFFVSDPPHLMKTTRNNLENSHGNARSRNLMVNGLEIGWHHIRDVYEWDLGEGRSALGLRLLPRLRDEHIRLTPQHRMKVKYAVQFLSSSVANALTIQGKESTKETIAFIKLFDRAFDCLNVARISPNSKADLQPYRMINDPRFEFLCSVIQYLDDWKDQLDGIVVLTADEKRRHFISQQTYHGWKITILSFIELTQSILMEEGVQFVLSEKFSQDPLEQHFSRHRRMGGGNTNPSYAEFQRQEAALRVIQSELISDLRGNSDGRQLNRKPLDITDTRLPRKRPGHSQSKN